jgi:hypothetical protein
MKLAVLALALSAVVAAVLALGGVRLGAAERTPPAIVLHGNSRAHRVPRQAVRLQVQHRVEHARLGTLGP